MLADKRIIGRVGSYQVAGGVHEVQLRDGSLHRLYMVHHQGLQSSYLRAMTLDGSNVLHVFDVRKLARSLAEDIATAPARDALGLITFTLRGAFPTADAFRSSVRQLAEVSSAPVPELAAA